MFNFPEMIIGGIGVKTGQLDNFERLLLTTGRLNEHNQKLIAFLKEPIA